MLRINSRKMRFLRVAKKREVEVPQFFMSSTPVVREMVSSCLINPQQLQYFAYSFI